MLPTSSIENSTQTFQVEFEHNDNISSVELKLVPTKTSVGELVPDVDNKPNSEVAFRILFQQLHHPKKNGHRVHFLIAGGRKTLVIYGLVTAQLLFNEEDYLWHLNSAGDFLSLERLHPTLDDEVQLIPIPVIQWSNISPIIIDIVDIEDPFEALEKQRQLRFSVKINDGRAHLRDLLSPAEEPVVALLVKEGLSDKEIAKHLHLSPKTVGTHLEKVYERERIHWNVENVGRTQLISLLSLYYAGVT